MELKDLIKTEIPTATVVFRDDIAFTLRYVSRAKIQTIARQSQVMQYDPKTRARTPQLDQPKFLRAFLELCVTGWKGVTPRSAATLAPLDLGKVPADKLDEELTFSHDNLTALVAESSELDGFLQDAATDIRTFNPAKEEEEKN